MTPCVQIMSKVQLLDKGHCRLVQYMGTDDIIVMAARQSTDGAFRGWGKSCTECGWLHESEDHEAGCSRPDSWKPGDEKFLKFLWHEKHTVPFEHTAITFEVKAPITVMEQWYAHRTQSRSRMSGRYTEIPADDYVPSIELLMRNQEGSNKQANRAKGAPPLTEEGALNWIASLENLQDHSQRVYELGLSIGVPKERARGANTVFRYGQMWATANLLNWLKFLTLRQDPHAQEEIRVYANAIHDMLQDLFPRTLEIFDA